jgi:hypothetical protein
VEEEGKQSKSISFSTRQDVINKGLIRAVKKYYSEAFIPNKKVIYTFKNLESTSCLDAIDKVRVPSFPRDSFSNFLYSIEIKYSGQIAT